MFKVLSEYSKMKEVKGDSGGRSVSLLIFLAKPNLLTKKAEMRFVGH